MNKISGIYQILNKKNGKSYIGSSVNLNKRKSQHWDRLRKGNHVNNHLQSAWNKYGEDSFEFKIIEEVSNANLLLEREQYYIDSLEAVSKGYNKRLIAESNLGKRLSPETKAKLSKINKGKKLSMETRVKIGQTSKGRKHTAESKAKISKAKKGKKYGPVSQETREKLSKAAKGRKHTEESKARMSIIQKISHKRPEVRANMSAGQRRRKFTPEQLANMSIAQKLRFARLKEINLQQEEKNLLDDSSKEIPK